jgi:hypothetical protein
MLRPFVMRTARKVVSAAKEEESALIEALPRSVPANPRLVSLDGITKMSKASGETTDDE